MQDLIDGTTVLVLTVLPGQGADKAGEVLIEWASGCRIDIDLPARQFRVLRLLVEARQNDERWDIRKRGLRSAETIASLYPKQAGQMAPIRPETVTRYVMNLRQRILDATPETERDGMPDFITTVRGCGYRIADDVGFKLNDFSAC